ncbi:AAT family amino acid transporter [Myriangium duriaei CBS 260.36]|uniref:AAT family amino acid transporter n=1 Tax=Myriangium duriaei CBS 260.36 TaxID=1168546 RepID=A0A9P4MGX8_9PEZI|nr:AAT family amino acid transporter [Myriangium duriaei CBS 260.36]
MSHSPDSTEKNPVHYNKEAEVGAYDTEIGTNNELKKELKSRHMQMIAIGGAIGAGLFVGSGSALEHGGPASLLIGFLIIGTMLLFTVQALGELAVLYPVNGAFFTYVCRFINESWGFAIGWDYAISWLTILPFEITAACITINFWPGGAAVNPAVWVTVFLVVLIGIQVFGVRGYGEVEFFLAIIKICACLGFIILAIVIDCGGVPTDSRGYIGASYWHHPGAFRHGFKGFCSVFVTASFAFGGTELTGLCAAEAADPRKSIPLATKQVFWRISFFYILNLFLLGLIVPADNENLPNASGANTKASPFVIAIKLAGIKGLPSVFNACITMAVISVANSCAYGSTRTIQALATRGMAPRFFSKIDKQGRPIWCVALQVVFGFLAYINSSHHSGDVFNWLLALSGLSYFFVWGSICLAHIRFRAAWKYNGRSLDLIPYKAPFGVVGSAIGLGLNIMCLIAQFYVAVWPIGGGSGSSLAIAFFQAYLAAPLVIVLYLFWKVWARDWTLFVRVQDMDITTGLRENLEDLSVEDTDAVKPTWGNLPKRIVRGLL